ncbi:abortive infection family protein [Porphyromonas gingivalis]|mgnify:CR=1 FL=1|uniref:abortive infection family protein n=1 Tax=Porphyromonas gingivalis TaxID=837 RepID=UPI0024DF70D5|nr:abortive infection family protein [Porphyromonas gingivalis]WIM92338.1 abortive infection family protein [Porphyromonas gingivalis]
MGIPAIEKAACLKFFNQGGYVLDFNTADFDSFTEEVIGVPLCYKYRLSKGKSLSEYAHEASDTDVTKLFDALFQHYELSSEIERDRASLPDRYRQYERCRSIINREVAGDANSLMASQVQPEFNSDYINSQIELMLKMQEENPTEAIGKAKDFIESCCKTILEKAGIELNSKWDVTNLVDEVFKCFNIMPRNIDDDVKGAKSIKQVLGSLKAIAQGIAELRNLYGSGHGKPDSYRGLEPRHAQLAVGSSITLVRFMWDTYKRKSKN